MIYLNAVAHSSFEYPLNSKQTRAHTPYTDNRRTRTRTTACHRGSERTDVKLNCIRQLEAAAESRANRKIACVRAARESADPDDELRRRRATTASTTEAVGWFRCSSSSLPANHRSQRYSAQCRFANWSDGGVESIVCANEDVGICLSADKVVFF